MSAEPVAEAIPPEGHGTQITGDDVQNLRTLDWTRVVRQLNTDGYCWLASTRPGGAPHLRPLFAVWSETVAFVTSKGTTRKSRNLSVDGRAALASEDDSAHLIVEGDARRVTDQATLERASRAFLAVYGWPTTVAGGRLDAPYGAPTSGGPPYDVFAIAPTTAFALPLDESFLPTRWRFQASRT